jgi:uncharacterized protein
VVFSPIFPALEFFMYRFFGLLFGMLLPALALGQAWPVYETRYVNDYAHAIEEGAEGRITTALNSLREETGIEATVLTLYTRWGFEGGSIEEFATGLFNSWGIGKVETNDGILILVITQDREMRIELGSGYGNAFNREASDIIERIFIPAFKEGNYSDGIEDGTAAVIKRIARVHYAGEDPAASGGSLGIAEGIFAAIFALIAGGALFGRRIADRFSRCPQCGERGLQVTRHTLDQATRHSTGHGEKTVSCPHCGYSATTSFTIPRRRASTSSSSGGSFSGGSSSGGGASGRW